MGENLDNWMSIIRSCLISSKDPLTLYELNQDTKMLEGKEIPFKQLKFNSLEDMLRKIPGVLMSKQNGQTYVKVIPNEKTSHIAKMVSLQKQKKKMKRNNWNNRKIKSNLDQFAKKMNTNQIANTNTNNLNVTSFTNHNLPKCSNSQQTTKIKCPVPNSCKTLEFQTKKKNQEIKSVISQPPTQAKSIRRVELHKQSALHQNPQSKSDVFQRLFPPLPQKSFMVSTRSQLQNRSAWQSNNNFLVEHLDVNNDRFNTWPSIHKESTASHMYQPRTSSRRHEQRFQPYRSKQISGQKTFNSYTTDYSSRTEEKQKFWNHNNERYTAVDHYKKNYPNQNYWNYNNTNYTDMDRCYYQPNYFNEDYPNKNFWDYNNATHTGRDMCYYQKNYVDHNDASRFSREQSYYKQNNQNYMNFSHNNFYFYRYGAQTSEYYTVKPPIKYYGIRRFY